MEDMGGHVVTALATGELEFKVYVSGANSVEIVGSFTGWGSKPLPLEATGDGWWRGILEVAPGDHEFLYMIDGWRPQTDYAAHGVKLTRDGQWVSRLAVRRPSSRSAA